MIKLKKVGGIHFLSIGRLRFSFCIARKPAKAAKPVREVGYCMPAMTPAEAAAYRAKWAATCNAMTKGDW